MLELKQLEKEIVEKLDLIRNKETKTLNDITEYEELQEKLRTIHKVMCWIKE